MSVRLWVVTANIGRGESTASARDNIMRIRHGYPNPVVGWQEIDEADGPDEHHILGNVFGPATYRNVGFQKSVPISVPAPWTVEKGTATHACQWLAHCTPDRWVVSALCTHPDLSEPVVFMNGHYPLARLGGRQGRSRWRDTQAAWVKVAAEWHRRGYTIITTRDTNRLRRMPRLHPLERQLLPNAISRISVIPGSVAVSKVGSRDVNLTIDGHSARGVQLALTVK